MNLYEPGIGPIGSVPDDVAQEFMRYIPTAEVVGRASGEPTSDGTRDVKCFWPLRPVEDFDFKLRDRFEVAEANIRARHAWTTPTSCGNLEWTRAARVAWDEHFGREATRSRNEARYDYVLRCIREKGTPLPLRVEIESWRDGCAVVVGRQSPIRSAFSALLQLGGDYRYGMFYFPGKDAAYLLAAAQPPGRNAVLFECNGMERKAYAAALVNTPCGRTFAAAGAEMEGNVMVRARAILSSRRALPAIKSTLRAANSAARLACLGSFNDHASAIAEAFILGQGRNWNHLQENPDAA